MPPSTCSHAPSAARRIGGGLLLAVAAALAVPLGGPARLAAQGRQTSTNTNFWLTLNGEYEVKPHWFADYELNMRWSGPFEEKMQVLPRVSVRYQARPWLRFNWGYNFVETWPYGSLPVALRFPEHRMWEQVQLSHPAGRVNLSHRYRLEQRWNGRTAEENGDVVVTNWVRVNRIRYRVQGQLPLQGPTLDVGEFYASASSEVMLQWGANVQANMFDQNRLVFTVGKRFAKGLRMETGYMEQLILRANGRSLERNHTLLFTVFPSHTLGR